GSNTMSKEALLSQIQLRKPKLRLHYKINKSQQDNLPIYKIKLNDTLIKSNNDTPLDALNIDIAKDTKTLDAGILNDSSLDSNLQDILSKIYSSLKQTYAKDYLYQYLYLQLDSNTLSLVLLIPQKIPQIYKQAYKNYEHKDYGIGKYNEMYRYNAYKYKEMFGDYTDIGLSNDYLTHYTKVFYAPALSKKIQIELAYGVDSVLESRDRELEKDSAIQDITKILVVNAFKKTTNRLWRNNDN
ncbi:hypothetical protein OQH60_03510, partial [Campylobacter sp. MIT 21-1685]|nr:hypothetical protein [Campylobacter sp. MIT 21-1684]MCX2751212.1 hypothetical protein [Campylobacter sp. MIT 21-1682]MCX2807411.1 hypothetical protein [Campylobacter sp. MIT 21-1685]